MQSSAKTALLEAIAGQNRGILSSPDDQTAILEMVSRLEADNPVSDPLNHPEMLDGDWRLLYTTSDELLGINRFPLYALGQVYQCVRTRDARIYNLAEVNGLPLLNGLVSVTAQYEATSDRRVNVSFNRAIFGLQSLVSYHTPASFINQIEAGESFRAIDFKITNREQRGWLEITYLDEDCRVGRGNQGSVFVLTKPTTTSGISS